MHYPWLSKSRANRQSHAPPSLARLVSGRKIIKGERKDLTEKNHFKVVEWQKFRASFFRAWPSSFAIEARFVVFEFQICAYGWCARFFPVERRVDFSSFLSRRKVIHARKMTPSTLYPTRASAPCSSPSSRCRCKRFSGHAVGLLCMWCWSSPCSMPSARYQCLLLRAYPRYRS